MSVIGFLPMSVKANTPSLFRYIVIPHQTDNRVLNLLHTVLSEDDLCCLVSLKDFEWYGFITYRKIEQDKYICKTSLTVDTH